MTTRFADVQPLAHADRTVRRSCRTYRLGLPGGALEIRVLREESEGLGQASSTMLCVSPRNLSEAKRLLLGGAGYRDEGDVLIKEFSDGNDALRHLLNVLEHDCSSEGGPRSSLHRDEFTVETLEFGRTIAEHARLAFAYHYDEWSAAPWALTLAYWQREANHHVIPNLDKVPFKFTREELHHSGEVCTLFEKRMRTYESLLWWAHRAAEHVEAAAACPS
jgi:hypothetical protein